VLGFQKSLEPHLKPHYQKALILGDGGAAAAVKYALEQLGIGYESVTRSNSEIGMTFDTLIKAKINEYHLIINATPLGTYPNIHEMPQIPYDALTPQHHLYDLVYNPEITAFMQQGIAHGATVQNGSEMLILQAEENWRHWNS
jgi:shikimate dehydrogenase